MLDIQSPDALARTPTSSSELQSRNESSNMDNT
jgi:hypothetical protein